MTIAFRSAPPIPRRRVGRLSLLLSVSVCWRTSGVGKVGTR